MATVLGVRWGRRSGLLRVGLELRMNNGVRRFGVVFASVGVLGLTACGGGGSGDAGGSTGGGEGESVTIRFADSFPPGHVITVTGTEFFMERATELSDGEIEFEHYPAEQLAAAPDLLDAAKGGISDMSYVGVAYVSDLPLSDVGTLPGSFQDSVAGTEAYWALVKEDLLDVEYLPQGVRPMYATLLPPYNLGTKEKVTKVEDLRGMTMRSSGGTMSRTITALGGTPVQMPAPEINQAMQRGTVEVWVGPPSSMPPYDLQDIISYGTTNLNLGSFSGVFVINEDFYQGLSQEHRDILNQAGEETVTNLAEGVLAENDRVITEFREQGIDMYELPAEEVARWNELTAPVWDQWAEEMNGRGLEGDGVVENWRTRLTEAGQ